MHSESTIPASQTQTVPSTAIRIIRQGSISGTAITATAASSTTAPAMPM